MGYIGQMSWNAGENWSIQSRYQIGLDDINCSSGYWSSCSYVADTHNCGHTEDVFLQCNGDGESIYSDNSTFTFD